MTRYCVLCGRRLRNGIKYCIYCKNPSLLHGRKKQSNPGMGLFLLMIIFVFILMFIGYNTIILLGRILFYIVCVLILFVIFWGILWLKKKIKLIE
jgi:lipopolysaccharide export LptBFGC system permease protein LptF